MEIFELPPLKILAAIVPFSYGMSNYRYSTLGGVRSIRIVQLMPSLYGDQLRVELVEVALEDERKCAYEALSYVWGIDQPDHAILCGGERLLITTNCAIALRRFRRKTTTRILWVDSICINQSSISERNNQVKLMKDIYSLAQQVLVWVGESDSNSDTAMKYLAHLAWADDLTTSGNLLSRFGSRLRKRTIAQLESRHSFMSI
jgi:hypothetical protein